MNTPTSIQKLLNDIRFKPESRIDLFLKQTPAVRAQLLLKLSNHIKYNLLKKLNDTNLVDTLEHLDPDDATDVIQLLPKQRQKRIILLLSHTLRESVALLNEFDPATAAGIMNIDYIQVNIDDSISLAAKKFKAHEKRTGRPPAMLVMKNGKLVGYLPGHQLGFANPNDTIGNYKKRINSIKHHANHDDVLRIFNDNPHNKIAVIGKSENVIGIIYSDDVIRIIENKESASLYDFAGVHEEETVIDSAKTKVLLRYKWLIINLGTAFLAAFTVGLFEETISTYVLLAVYMPIVAGMGGNAATQTLAVLVRGIALKQIDLHTAIPTLRRELIAGFVNGLITGIIVAAIVLIFNKDIKIAFILGLAMIVNLLVAAFFGTIVPLIMQRFGKDPATSATIFITTATDVLGFLVFLGLATIIL